MIYLNVSWCIFVKLDLFECILMYICKTWFIWMYLDVYSLILTFCPIQRSIRTHCDLVAKKRRSYQLCQSLPHKNVRYKLNNVLELWRFYREYIIWFINGFTAQLFWSRCLSPVPPVLSGWESLIPPGWDTNPSQVSSQQMLGLI